MDINTLIETFSEAIAADDDLKAWSNLYYSQDHQVFVNVDVRDMPGESDCPYVGLLPVSKFVGKAVSTKEHSLGVFCCIHDSSSVTTPLNIVKFKGVERIEEFRKLVEDVIVANAPTNILMAEVEIDYDTITEFPFMTADMLVKLTEPVTLGSDYLE